MLEAGQKYAGAQLQHTLECRCGFNGGRIRIRCELRVEHFCYGLAMDDITMGINKALVTEAW